MPAGVVGNKSFIDVIESGNKLLRKLPAPGICPTVAAVISGATL